MKRSFFAPILIAALCLTLLAGCGKAAASPSDLPKPENTLAPTAMPTEEPTPAPTAEPTEAPTPEPDTDAPVNTGRTGTVEFVVEGQAETLELPVYAADINGRTFTLCVDDERFNAYYFEGELELASVSEPGVEPLARAHLCCMTGVTADIAAEQALGQFPNAADEGMTKLGGHDAYCVSSSTGDEGFTVYYIPFGEDTLAVSIYSFGTEAAEGLVPLLLAMAATVAAD